MWASMLVSKATPVTVRPQRPLSGLCAQFLQRQTYSQPIWRAGSLMRRVRLDAES